MKQTLYNIGIWLFTSVSGIANMTNIITWLTDNKIFFSISGSILITTITFIWWLLKIRNDNRKNEIEMKIKLLEYEERKISCEEKRIELEITKNDINRKI